MLLDEQIAPVEPVSHAVSRPNLAPTSGEQTTSYKGISKWMVDAAKYDALLAERRKYDAQADFLRVKADCARIKYELLQISLQEKKYNYEEISTTD